VAEFDTYLWSPATDTRIPEVRIVHEDDDGERLSHSDAPFWTAHSLLLRAKAARALESTITGAGRFRPIDCREDELTMFRSSHLLDLLSEGSDLMTLPNGVVIGILRAVPKLAAEISVPMFGLKVWGERSPMYVSDSFVKAWREAGLVGLEFDPLW
jgi:hypothetical protein